MAGAYGAGNTTARGEFARNFHKAGLTGGHKVIQNFVDHGFIENAPVAETEEVVLQGFQLNAGLIGYIINFDGAEIRQARLGAD